MFSIRFPQNSLVLKVRATIPGRLVIAKTWTLIVGIPEKFKALRSPSSTAPPLFSQPIFRAIPWGSRGMTHGHPVVGRLSGVAGVGMLQ